MNTLANKSLSEYFGYRPWSPDYIVTCDLEMALTFQGLATPPDAPIENIDIIEYDHKTRVGMDETTHKIYVCFIKYSDFFLSEYDPLESAQTRRLYSVVRLIGKYPEYIKDRWCEWATSLRGQPAVDLFNADMNMWLKHAVTR